MTVCCVEHEEIVYLGRICPLCRALDRLEVLEGRQDESIRLGQQAQGKADEDL